MLGQFTPINAYVSHLLKTHKSFKSFTDFLKTYYNSPEPINYNIQQKRVLIKKL